MAEHKVLWLQPSCAECEKYSLEGRQWCKDPQEDCEECGRKWVRYELSPISKAE